jgi:hypothetical protein
MIVGKAINARLAADTSVNAIVSGRIYPGASPENVYPLICYDVAHEQVDNLDREADLQPYDVTIGIVATDYGVVTDLAAKVKTALHRQAGTWGGVVVEVAVLTDESEDAFADGANPERMYFDIEQSYRVMVRTRN